MNQIIIPITVTYRNTNTTEVLTINVNIGPIVEKIIDMTVDVAIVKLEKVFKH